MTKSLRNRIIGSGEVAPDQILAHPQNWRRHPAFQQAALDGALNEIGWIQQVIINQRTGHLIDGHLRVTLALRRNEPTIPVLYVDLDEREEKLALATLDPMASLAEINGDALGQLIEGLSVNDQALETLLETLALDAESEREPDSERIRNLGNHATARVKVVLAVADAEIFERAMRATHLQNRGEALIKLSESFLNAEGQLDAGA